MGPVLEADADALRRLGTAFGTTADAIAGLRTPDPIVMPDSAILTASVGASTVVGIVYGRIADRIRRMSDAATTDATSYEDTDQVFRDELQRYRTGQD